MIANIHLNELDIFMNSYSSYELYETLSRFKEGQCHSNKKYYIFVYWISKTSKTT